MKKMSIEMKYDLVVCTLFLIISFIYTFKNDFRMHIFTIYGMLWLIIFKIDEYKNKTTD